MSHEKNAGIGPVPPACIPGRSHSAGAGSLWLLALVKIFFLSLPSSPLVLAPRNLSLGALKPTPWTQFRPHFFFSASLTSPHALSISLHVRNILCPPELRQSQARFVGPVGNFFFISILQLHFQDHFSFMEVGTPDLDS